MEREARSSLITRPAVEVRRDQEHPKRLQDRSRSAQVRPRSCEIISRDVDRKVENKRFNLKSEDHTQTKQRGAARDERSEDLKSEDHAQSKAARRSTQLKFSAKETLEVLEQPEHPEPYEVPEHPEHLELYELYENTKRYVIQPCRTLWLA